MAVAQTRSTLRALMAVALLGCSPHRPRRSPVLRAGGAASDARGAIADLGDAGAAADATDLIPFWGSDMMHDESVLMVIEADGVARGTLLWPADVLLKVSDASRRQRFVEGRDFDHAQSSPALTLRARSRAPALRAQELAPDGQPLIQEGHFFHSYQLSVSYRHSQRWSGPRPDASPQLQRTRAKLEAGEPIELVVFGDSISLGHNASGFSTAAFEAVPPYLPPWPLLVTQQLEAHYGVHVELHNPSQAGKTAAWGREHVHELVSVHVPDLVIVGFGMNDGSLAESRASYRANIQSILDDVRGVSPQCEFILVASMLANPSWSAAGDQRQYLAELMQLSAAQPGVALADMTTTHGVLLERKRYADMTGNGINHPNDFLVRWYAQLVLALLNASE